MVVCWIKLGNCWNSRWTVSIVNEKVHVIIPWTVPLDRLSHVSPLSTPSLENEILHYPRKRNLEQYTVAMQVSRTNGRTNSRRECGYRFSIKFSTVAWSITGNMRSVSSRIVSSLEKPAAFERVDSACTKDRSGCTRKSDNDDRILSTAGSINLSVIKNPQRRYFLADIKNFIILSWNLKGEIVRKMSVVKKNVIPDILLYLLKFAVVEKRCLFSYSLSLLRPG